MRKKLNLKELKVQSFVTDLKHAQPMGGDPDLVACGVTLCPPCTREIPCWTGASYCPDCQNSRDDACVIGIAIGVLTN